MVGKPILFFDGRRFQFGLSAIKNYGPLDDKVLFKKVISKRWARTNLATSDPKIMQAQSTKVSYYRSMNKHPQ
jgi:hypothetical protein